MTTRESRTYLLHSVQMRRDIPISQLTNSNIILLVHFNKGTNLHFSIQKKIEVQLKSKLHSPPSNINDANRLVKVENNVQNKLAAGYKKTNPTDVCCRQ